MECPTCPETTLAMSNREGIEIDYCPKCRGVWLDRGELDKLIERSAAPAARGPDTRAAHSDPRYAGGRDRGYDDDDDDYRKQGRGRRRGGFLGDLFEFD
jgi:uncharacterized protein